MKDGVEDVNVVVGKLVEQLQECESSLGIIN